MYNKYYLKQALLLASIRIMLIPHQSLCLLLHNDETIMTNVRFITLSEHPQANRIKIGFWVYRDLLHHLLKLQFSKIAVRNISIICAWCCFISSTVHSDDFIIRYCLILSIEFAL